MKTALDSPALSCNQVTVQFPLVSNRLGWKLVFGVDVDEWHDALSDVSLTIPKGKIVGVIGHNGAGKSTLLRTFAGIYPPSSGRVIRLGPVNSLFELGGIGGLLITGKQYALRWLRMNEVPKSKWPELIEEIRDFSELGDRLDNRIYTYSTGMAARLYFSTATSVGHDIYLIDEILSVGDEHFQAKCWQRVRERLAKGASGVLVTHDWSAILRLCEYACELKNGQIINEGVSEQIISGYLKLADQLDPHRLAYFADECPITFRAFSGEDWVCEIPIIVTADGPVFFSYSIEKIVIGEDWQILFMGTETLVASRVGKYRVKIKVPAMPLCGGEYRLNLFLSGSKPAGGGPKPNFDIRSWTAGNSLTLKVVGPISPALVEMRLVTE